MPGLLRYCAVTIRTNLLSPSAFTSKLTHGIGLADPSGSPMLTPTTCEMMNDSSGEFIRIFHCRVA
jgi:hypothetical protein